MPGFNLGIFRRSLGTGRVLVRAERPRGLTGRPAVKEPVADSTAVHENNRMFNHKTAYRS